jgi:oxygen-independent coproporphyrinogen-3 oxidase
LPDENEEREMYYLIKEKLKENGYEHYEISNFSKAGFESRHNTSYWERQNYLGFGLGASSCFEEIRFSNTSNLDEYIKDFSSFVRDREELEKEDIDSEKVILGLRMLKGINEELVCYDKWKESLKKLISAGLVIKEEGKIRLTDKGLDLANQVFVEFV